MQFCTIGVSRLLAACLLFAASLSSASEIKLQQPGMVLTFDTQAVSARLTDTKTGKLWDLGRPVALTKSGQQFPLQADSIKTSGDTALTFHSNAAGIDILIRLLTAPIPGVVYSISGWAAGSQLSEIRLLQNALTLTAQPNSYYAVPKSLGILVTPAGANPAQTVYDAYHVGNGYSMAMFGAVKDGSALLIDWNTPDVNFATEYAPQPQPTLHATFALQPGATELRIRPLGAGGYVEIAKAYRRVAEQEGLLKTTAQKEHDNPKLAKLIGAAEFKQQDFVNRKARNGVAAASILQSSFEENALLATHLKSNVGIDRAMLVISGWNRAGYDNQLPDILPANAQAGGNAGLSACSRQVKSQGWLFGLHDNYQDMYEDSPSFDPKYLVKRADGSPMKGGFWAGGQAYFICSKESIKLISRPQNLPEVKRLFAPDVYFLDTVFASPGRICYDPAHPTTKAEDFAARQALCDYVRQQPMIMGTEEGNELGIAHTDYFEGMLSQKTRSHAAHSETVIPLFPLVYGDSILLYTHQSDKLAPENAPQFLDHILYAAMPIYYVGDHSYWTTGQPYTGRPGTHSAELVFTQGEAASSRIDNFILNTYSVLSPLQQLTALTPMTGHRFLTADNSVEQSQFGQDIVITVNYGPKPYQTTAFTLPPYGFFVQAPSFEAFYAVKALGNTFSQPTYLTLRSIDGRPLNKAQKVTIHRCFGDTALVWQGKRLSINRDLVVSRSPN